MYYPIFLGGFIFESTVLAYSVTMAQALLVMAIVFTVFAQWKCQAFLMGLLCAVAYNCLFLNIQKHHDIEARFFKKTIYASVEILKEVRKSHKVNVYEARILQSTVLSFQGYGKKIKLSDYHHHSLEPGQQCNMLIKIRPVTHYYNPGGIDLGKSWLAKSIMYQSYIVQKDLIICHKKSHVRYGLNQLRKKIKEKMLFFSKESDVLSILLALALGVKNMDPTVSQIFMKTGTSHMLAISGLHVSLICFFLLIIIKPVAKMFVIVLNIHSAQKISLSLCCIGVFAYILLTGSAVSSQRAGWMFFIYTISVLADLRLSKLFILLIAMTSMILANPFVVYDTGFWLSTGMVFVLICSYDYCLLNKESILAFIKTQLKLFPFASLLSLFFIGESAMVSPLANLVAIPWLSFIMMPFLLLFQVLIFISPQLAEFCFKFAEISGMLLIKWLSLFKHFPIVILDGKTLASGIALGIAFLILLGPYKKTSWVLVTYFFLLGFLDFPKRPMENEAWVTFLDVGQGLSVLVQTQKHVLLYDTGPAYEEFIAANYTILPFLKSEKIKKLDELWISHEDLDHRGGLSLILKNMPVDVLRTGERIRIAHKNQYDCHEAMPWEWDGVLFTPLPLSLLDDASHNDHSCVLKITAQGQSVLLTGDIEQTGEAYLSSKFKNLKSTILSVPHHGSKTSSTEAFLQAVSPKFAIISSGFLNSYHHPHPTVLRRYLNQGVKTLNTAQTGAIRVKLARNGRVEMRCHKGRQC